MKFYSIILLLVGFVMAFGGSSTSIPTATNLPSVEPTVTTVPSTSITPDAYQEFYDKISCAQYNLTERAECQLNLKDWTYNYPLYVACENNYYKKNYKEVKDCQELAEEANDCRRLDSSKQVQCINKAFQSLPNSKKLLWNRLFKLYVLEYKAQKKNVSLKQKARFIEYTELQKRKIVKGITTAQYNKILETVKKKLNVMEKQ